MHPNAHRRLLRALFNAAVDAVHPRATLPAALPPAPETGRIILLAAGKAAGSMTAAAEAHYLGEGVSPDRLMGLGVARHGYEAPTAHVRVVGAGHPVPDDAGLRATREVLDIARQSAPEDTAVVLVSGGGSANWIAPAADITLVEKQTITRALLQSGAPIQVINGVRKHLSRIKGGQLVRTLNAGRIVTLAISDVPGDDPSTIASGPTVPDPTTRMDALSDLARYGIMCPASVMNWLSNPASETPKPDDPIFQRTEFHIVTRPRDGLAAAERAARTEGYEVVSLGADLEGEARDVAQAHARRALELRRAGRRAVLLSGGELTVTIRGQGRGGPNQEYALALALALGGVSGITALAGDTDGTDGGGGSPSDPAGALIDATTLERASAASLDPADFLARNDSTGFFEQLGDLLMTGPTLTNANDLRAIVIEP
jgi:hydroxypyruvate reductase